MSLPLPIPLYTQKLKETKTEIPKTDAPPRKNKYRTVMFWYIVNKIYLYLYLFHLEWIFFPCVCHFITSCIGHLKFFSLYYVALPNIGKFHCRISEVHSLFSPPKLIRETFMKVVITIVAEMSFSKFFKFESLGFIIDNKYSVVFLEGTNSVHFWENGLPDIFESS